MMVVWRRMGTNIYFMHNKPINHKYSPLVSLLIIMWESTTCSNCTERGTVRSVLLERGPNRQRKCGVLAMSFEAFWLDKRSNGHVGVDIRHSGTQTVVGMNPPPTESTVRSDATNNKTHSWTTPTQTASLSTTSVRGFPPERATGSRRRGSEPGLHGGQGGVVIHAAR